MRRVLFLIILTALSFASCFTVKKIQTTNPPPTTNLKKENAYSLMTKLKSNDFNYRWMSSRFTVDFSSDSSNDSFSGVIRMRKDSIIWMTISAALGTYTAVHAKLNEDSVQFIDHYHGQYFKGTYDHFDSLWGEDIDFELLQSVMMGNSLDFYHDTSKIKAYYDGREYILSTVRKRRFKRLMYRNKPLHSKSDAQLIWIDPNDFHITKIRLEDFMNHRTFEASYDDFQKGDSGISFPMHIHYEINAEKVIKIDLKYKKVNFAEYESIPFKIPPKYEQIHY